MGIIPSIIVLRFSFFASTKVNNGYFCFSCFSPYLYSSEPLLSADGLISAPEIQIGAEFVF